MSAFRLIKTRALFFLLTEAPALSSSLTQPWWPMRQA